MLAGLPPRLWDHFERVSLPEGTRLIAQGDEPDDVFVLESGRLLVELTTPEGTQMRLSTVIPGVVVGEMALYTAAPRTADVIAETPSVVLRISRDRTAGSRRTRTRGGAAPLVRDDARPAAHRYDAVVRLSARMNDTSGPAG